MSLCCIFHLKIMPVEGGVLVEVFDQVLDVRAKTLPDVQAREKTRCWISKR